MWVMDTNPLPTDSDALLSLIQRAKENYQMPPPALRARGKQRDFSGLSFLLLAVVAVVTRTFRDRELHRLLTRDDRLREALELGRVPHRTTIGRRLVGLLAEAAEQVRWLGESIAAEVEPEAGQSAVSVIDGRMYEAQGPKWHASDRRAGRLPRGLRNVDTASSWSKSGRSRLGARLPTARARAGLPDAGAGVGRVASHSRIGSADRATGTCARALARDRRGVG